MRRLLLVAAGAAGTVAVLRGARDVTQRHVPAGARSTLGAVGWLLAASHRAAAELRTGTAQREAELRTELLAGADLPSARARVDAWRAERAAHAAAGSGGRTGEDDPAGPGAPTGSTAVHRAAARPGSAAGAARPTGAHRAENRADSRADDRADDRAEDPEDGPEGYSFF